METGEGLGPRTIGELEREKLSQLVDAFSGEIALHRWGIVHAVGRRQIVEVLHEVAVDPGQEIQPYGEYYDASFEAAKIMGWTGHEVTYLGRMTTAEAAAEIASFHHAEN